MSEAAQNRPPFVAQLRRVLSETAGLSFALLFGSEARQQSRPGSDLDVGFWPERDWSLGEELALQGRLAAATGRQVDLVRLDRASTLLCWEVAKHAVPLSGSRDAFTQFQARAALDYAEFAPDLRRASQAYLERVAKG